MKKSLASIMRTKSETDLCESDINLFENNYKKL